MTHNDPLITTPSSAHAARPSLDGLIARGAQLHADGQPQLALVEFEKALATAPGDLNASSACAALLTELSRPQAAYRLLQGVQDQLLQDADGAANLAIAAENCGEFEQALQHYTHALTLNPDHVRALNNLGLMALRSGRHEEAVLNARRCVELQPDEVAWWLNLSDLLTASRRHADALQHLDLGLQKFRSCDDMKLRRAVVLAFMGEFEASKQAFEMLRPDVLARFEITLAQAGTYTDSEGFIQRPPLRLPDVYQLYTRSAFEAIRVCDWRECGRLADTLRKMLADCLKTGQGRDQRDAQHYGICLGLHENELAQMREISVATIAAHQSNAFPAYQWPQAPHPDGRIHVGIAIQSLRDQRFTDGLARQLQMHDHERFCLHLYSPTPEPQGYLVEALNMPRVNVAEIAHMSDDEAVQRMRYDKLDLFFDMAFDTPWCRPEIPSRRVAPVQVRQLTWHRHNPPQPCEYNFSDTFVHPDGNDLARYGAIVRFPHTCWIDACDDLPSKALFEATTHSSEGLPKDALVLCSFLPGIMIDPLTFATWMQMLRALPDAVLWLPGFNPNIQNNLRRETSAAGLEPSRLVFAQRRTGPDARVKMLASLPLADLFVDALRFNANHGLVDALRMGVPAITSAGHSMASRLGGSILRAAGLPGGVFETPAALVDAAVSLGRDQSKLSHLRAQLAAARPSAPLFDAQARVRELEAAWTTIAERSRAGLRPASFDVPSCG